MRVGNHLLRRGLLFLAALALVGATSESLSAKECFYSGGVQYSEMTFLSYHFFADSSLLSDTRVIMADGSIAKGTTEKFRAFLQTETFRPETTVYLRSTGGNFGEGLDLGRLIRERGFNTAIGTKPLLTWGMGGGPPEGGVCLSSCTFTFLGGVKRQMHKDDLYGVHRFRSTDPNLGPDLSMQIAQQNVGALLEYVRTMGAGQALIEDMSHVGPENINSLPISRLRDLNVINAPLLPDRPLPSYISCK